MKQKDDFWFDDLIYDERKTREPLMINAYRDAFICGFVCGACFGVLACAVLGAVG